jgi:hypothetical protein
LTAHAYKFSRHLITYHRFHTEFISFHNGFNKPPKQTPTASVIIITVKPNIANTLRVSDHYA